MRATLNNRGLPYQFKVLEGGCFTPENQYGSISCTQFSLIGVLLGGNRVGQNGGMEQGGNGEEQNGGMEQGEQQNGGGEQKDYEEEEKKGKERGSCGGEEETQESEEDKVYCKPFLKTHNALSSAAKGI